MPKRMAITRASKLFFVGATFVLLVPHVLGQGGGGGQGGGDRGNTRGGGGVDKGGGVSSTKDGRTSSQSNISSSVSASTSIAHGASLSNSTMSSPPDARTTTSTSASTSMSMSPPLDDASEDASPPPPDAPIATTSARTSSAISTPPPSDNASKDVRTPPPYDSITATSTTTSTTPTDPPPGDASEEATPPPPDASIITATNASSSTTTTSMTPLSDNISDDTTSPPFDGSEGGSLPPIDAFGSSTGPSDQQGPGGGASSTDGSNIYFPSQYTAECDHYGEDAHYAVKLSGTVRQAWSDTGCPNHVNWGVDKGPDYHFPGRIVPSNISIPAYPMLIGDGGTTDLSVTNGQVAILVNGVAMFSAWATRPVTDYNSTAFYLEGDTLDACGGHATTEGWYHYHGTPGCLEEQVMAGEGLTMDDHSPFLGWSYDGFPMYGHLGPSGTEMRACDTHGADETYCLDTCSGYEGEMPDIDSFTYRYYLTCGYDESFFPMTINCFRGCCPDGMECNAIVELCDEMAEPGYTSSYEPEVGYNYTDVYELEVLSGDDSKYINSSTVANCTMFYNETLKYTVQQISIEDYPIAPTTPSPASSGRGAGNTHGPTPSSVVSSEAPVHGFISSLQESPTTTPGGVLTTASPIIPSAI